jgi:hypothetical protein
MAVAERPWLSVRVRYPGFLVRYPGFLFLR